MRLGIGDPTLADARRSERDDVDYGASAVSPDGSRLELRIVNISPHGLMARCEVCPAVGRRLRVTLPKVGAIDAEVRWAMGGRIGCEFAEPIDLAGYYDLLAALVRRG